MFDIDEEQNMAHIAIWASEAPSDNEAPDEDDEDDLEEDELNEDDDDDLDDEDFDDDDEVYEDEPEVGPVGSGTLETDPPVHWPAQY